MGRNSIRPSVWLALRPRWVVLRPLLLALRPLQLALRPLQLTHRPLQLTLRPLLPAHLGPLPYYAMRFYSIKVARQGNR